MALDGHVRQVLEFASGRVDQARGQFLASAFLCLEAAGRRLVERHGALGGLARGTLEAVDVLDAAGGTQIGIDWHGHRDRGMGNDAFQARARYVDG